MTSSMSTNDLLWPAPTLGQRVDSFEWELLTRDLDLAGSLSPSLTDTPTLNCATDGTIVRSITGLQLLAEDAADINPFTDRVRPVMVLGNGDRFPLGVYLFGEHARNVGTQAEFWSPTLYDQGLLLQDKMRMPYGIPKGATISPYVRQILNDTGIRQYIETGAGTVGAPIVWPAGTVKDQILTDLATAGASLRPYFDNFGLFRMPQSPDATVAADPQFLYQAERIEANTIIESDDSYKAPNRYIVIGQNQQTPVWGRYDVPANAPHSIANRGYVVSETFDVPGATTNEQCIAIARTKYLQDRRSWQRIEFDTPLDPRMDVFSVVQYDGVDLPATLDPAIFARRPKVVGTFIEVAFSMELKSGGTHHHVLARYWEGVSDDGG